MRIMGEPEKDEQEEPRQDEDLREGRGGSRRIIFVAILIVLVLFGYLYFFTDLIRSHEEPQQEAEAPVRKPLPRKGGPLGSMSTSVKPAASGATTVKPGAKPADAPRTGDQALPAKPAQDTKSAVGAGEPPKKPAPAEQKVAQPVVPPPDKASPKAPHPEPARQPAAAPRTTGGAAVTSSGASSPVKTAAAKPAPQAVTTVEKPLPHKAPPPAVPPVKPSVKPVPATTPGEGTYAIQCGPFATNRELVPARDALKKAGLDPAASPGPKKPTHMYRLFVAGYSDAAVAANERNKLLEATPDAFVLRHDGNYELFAGSYHEEERAAKMQGRLSARGITVELRQVTTPVATRRLIAGEFPTRDAAGAMVERLKSNGFACSVTQRGH